VDCLSTNRLVDRHKRSKQIKCSAVSPLPLPSLPLPLLATSASHEPLVPLLVCGNNKPLLTPTLSSLRVGGWRIDTSTTGRPSKERIANHASKLLPYPTYAATHVIMSGTATTEQTYRHQTLFRDQLHLILSTYRYALAARWSSTAAENMEKTRGNEKGK